MNGPVHDIIDPSDSAQRQTEKLMIVCEALMTRAEQIHDDRGAAYGQFQRAVLLEDQVRERTRELERALDLLAQSNSQLAEATDAAERTRSDLANAIETIQDGIAIFDPEERLIHFNSRFCLQMPDVRRQLTPGMQFADYVRTICASRYLVLPHEMTPEAWAIERMASHAEEHVMFNVRFTGDCWIQVSDHRTPGGQTVVTQTDVTDIIRAEREEHEKILDDQASIVRATLEHLAQGVGIFDARSRLAGFNQRLATMLSIPLTQLRPGLDADNLFARFRREVTLTEGTTAATIQTWISGAERGTPLRFSFRRGSTKWFDVFAKDMPGGGFVISVTDISETRRAAIALAEANEMLEARVASRTLELEDALSAAERANTSRTRFVAAASHDLLQPLSAAKLYLSAIEDTVAGGPAEDVLGKASSALEGVQDIIDALLDISRLESRQFEPDIRPVPLLPVVHQLQDAFEPAAAAKGLELRLYGRDETILTDAGFFRRILQNLIGNAIRYTDSGRVIVGIRPMGPNVSVGIWDTGPGIPEGEQENVFKEFHRVKGATSGNEGLGLGLAIVDRACASLGHPLSMTSKPGRGTTFTVMARRATPGQIAPRSLSS